MLFMPSHHPIPASPVFAGNSGKCAEKSDYTRGYGSWDKSIKRRMRTLRDKKRVGENAHESGSQERTGRKMHPRGHH